MTRTNEQEEAAQEFERLATELYEKAYKSMPPVDFGSAACRRVLVPAIAEALRNQRSEGARGVWEWLDR